jgi:uncharacterized membrane protein
METELRSLVKSVSWRIVAIAVTLIVLALFTRSLADSLLYTFVIHLSKFFIYYAHERVWNQIEWERKP